ncbi:hypothetical protein CLF_100264 [Clonorchis sinensis]|uniref:Uncharacterized protein n=1 Tax=Clonorchis sinensis TaxID=79923 RepID=G7Y327_CLOSI|nr:hypothetical protein CLF_100264 [Clonorchis sinensis]
MANFVISFLLGLDLAAQSICYKSISKVSITCKFRTPDFYLYQHSERCASENNLLVDCSSEASWNDGSKRARKMRRSRLETANFPDPYMKHLNRIHLLKPPSDQTPSDVDTYWKVLSTTPDELMRRTLESLQNPGVQVVAGKNLVDLEYADEVAMFEDQGESQASLNRLTTVLSCFGTRLAPSKSFKVNSHQTCLLHFKLWRILRTLVYVLSLKERWKVKFVSEIVEPLCSVRLLLRTRGKRSHEHVDPEDSNQHNSCNIIDTIDNSRCLI